MFDAEEVVHGSDVLLVGVVVGGGRKDLQDVQLLLDVEEGGGSAAPCLRELVHEAPLHGGRAGDDNDGAEHMYKME